MPFMRLEAVKMRVDGKGTLKKIDQDAKKIFLEGTAIFLKEVVKHVPVWSGMSRGSLLPLARYLTDRGYKVSIPISPRPSSKRAQQRGQNIAAGEARGEFSVIVKDGTYQLIFQPKVRHYKTNEFTQMTKAGSALSRSSFDKKYRKKLKTLRHLNLKHPTPWQSFTYGNLKMRIFLTKAAKKMPNFVFKQTKISVGSARGI